MPEQPREDRSPESEDVETDGPLRIYAERLGIDFDAVVERAKNWLEEHPLPADVGPEPFNVGKPRQPVD